jgi:uncharacterized Ntn-hydrolase superfamily protein
MRNEPTRPVHTFSIVARDHETGQMGVAVQSHYFSVGSVVPWAEAGVGAVATQSLVRVEYGPEGLALLRQGQTASQALAALLARDEGRNVRQVAMVDARGDVAAHTGANSIAAAGHLTGDGFSVQANLMVDDTIWPAMKAGYEAARGDLADRFIAALEAGQSAGGDIRGQQSAALLIVSGERQEQPWQGRVFDLRVEDHHQPIEELRRLVRIQRAYRYADAGDQHVERGEFAAAMQAYDAAMGLAPDILELKFWTAATLFRVGREEDALNLFAEVFAKEPIWTELVPRLVPLGLVPNDPAAVKRITEVLTR